jgi:hypothetical protein
VTANIVSISGVQRIPLVHLCSCGVKICELSIAQLWKCEKDNCSCEEAFVQLLAKLITEEPAILLRGIHHIGSNMRALRGCGLATSDILCMCLRSPEVLMQPQGSVWRIAVLLYLSTCDICFEIFNRIHFTVLSKLKSFKEICDLQSTLVNPHLTII